MQSHIGLEIGVQPHLILDEDEMLIGPHLIGTQCRVDGIDAPLEIGLESGRPGIEGVQGHVASEADAVPVVEGIQEIDAATEIDDATLIEAGQPRGIGIPHRAERLAELHARIERILAPGQGNIGKEPWAPFVIPAQGRHTVAPIQTEIDEGAAFPVSLRGLESEVIRAIKQAQIHTIPLPDAPIHLAVEVVEEIPRLGLNAGVLLVGGVDDGPGQDVEIGAAPADHERGLVLDDGALDHQLGGQQRHIHRPMGLPHVAVLHLHLHHGRKTPAESGRKSTLGDGHLLDGVRIENREETEEVAHAVQWHTIQYNQILVRAAPADIESGSPFPSRLNPRHQLKGLEQIHLTADGGQLAHLVHRDLHPGHLDRILNALPLAHNHGFGNGHSGFEGEIQPHIGGQFHLDRLLLIADVGYGQCMLSRREVERIETKSIRAHSDRLLGTPYGRSGQHLTTRRILDIAVQLDPLRISP